MLNARQQRILAGLGGGAYVEVKDLAEGLGVDVSTIRRDLQTLTRQGLVERLHGGVRLHSAGAHLSTPRVTGHADRAAAVRRLLKAGDHIVLGGGPTADALVPLLFDLTDLTVVTNDLRAADRLAQHPAITVNVAGGELRDAPARATTSGPAAADFFGTVHADWSFVEVDGIHPFSGFTVASPWAVAVQRAMLEAARKRCIIAESTAIGLRCVGFISDVRGADLIITDDQLDDYDLPAFGGKVLRAAPYTDDNWRSRT